MKEHLKVENGRRYFEITKHTLSNELGCRSQNGCLCGRVGNPCVGWCGGGWVVVVLYNQQLKTLPVLTRQKTSYNVSLKQSIHMGLRMPTMLLTGGYFSVQVQGIHGVHTQPYVYHTF